MHISNKLLIFLCLSCSQHHRHLVRTSMSKPLFNINWNDSLLQQDDHHLLGQLCQVRRPQRGRQRGSRRVARIPRPGLEVPQADRRRWGGRERGAAGGGGPTRPGLRVLGPHTAPIHAWRHGTGSFNAATACWTHGGPGLPCRAKQSQIILSRLQTNP